MVSTTECKDNRSYMFAGKDQRYTIIVCRSDRSNKSGFIEMPESADLIEAVTEVYLGVYPERNRDLSRARVRKSLSYPRTTLMLAEHQGKPVGFGIFPRLLINGHIDREPVPVLYSSRGFLSEHERQGLGTHVLEEAIRLHQEELWRSHRSLRWVAFMTMNPHSVASLWKLPMVGETWPIKKPADDQEKPTVNYYLQDSTQQHIMLGVHSRVYMSSESISTRTGVSEGELRELGMNETYRPSPDQRLPYDIHQIMVHQLGMNREKGDVVYMTAEVKQPGESPLDHLA
ncbi:MAG: GNAT family N-acetyltransferase [Candidatus Daviesbacteria bacterium]|nr:GNAT family N-acetyltransferase [Candidatus Daviesbacteria bacterium]